MSATPVPSLIPPPAHIDDTHKHYDVAAAIIVMATVGTSVTLMRLYYQTRARFFGWEDWAIIPALLLYIGHTIMAVYCNLNGGVGKPLWEVTYGEFQVWFKGIVGSSFLYPAMTASVRISILLFYQRIFSQTHAFTRRVINGTYVAIAVYVVVYSVVPAFVCEPISYGWRLLDNKAAHCRSNDFFYKYTVSLYAVSLAFDVLLLVIPIYPVLQLQMAMRKRVGALVMFALGTSSCIAAAYKLAIFVEQWDNVGDINPRWFLTVLSRLVPPQFNHYGYTFWIPAQVEPTTAIIGASLPSMRHLMKIPYDRLVTAAKSMTGGATFDRTNNSMLSSQKSGLGSKQHPFVKIEVRNGSQHSQHSHAPLKTDYELHQFDSMA